MAKNNYNMSLSFTVSGKRYNETGEYFAYNKDALGRAAGELPLAALRAYLYFVHNKEGEPWTYNSTAYRTWLGSTKSLHSVDSTFKDSGIPKLIEFGYLKDLGSGNYEFSESPRQDWLDELKNQKSEKVT